jgi:hypothetical protein
LSFFSKGVRQQGSRRLTRQVHHLPADQRAHPVGKAPRARSLQHGGPAEQGATGSVLKKLDFYSRKKRHNTFPANISAARTTI